MVLRALVFEAGLIDYNVIRKIFQELCKEFPGNDFLFCNVSHNIFMAYTTYEEVGQVEEVAEMILDELETKWAREHTSLGIYHKDTIPGLFTTLCNKFPYAFYITLAGGDWLSINVSYITRDQGNEVLGAISDYFTSNHLRL